MYRELKEELGLDPSDVREVARMGSWVSYKLPARHRRASSPRCIGQKQLWWLLRLCSSEESIRLEQSEKPEFDDWQWVDYWLPLEKVVLFKREVYSQVLSEFQNSAGLRVAGKLR
ncbi:RNA pyrophosphohydrolase [Geodia barretti]|uniref:RNA pyrophosphohydrolase n=2 Tax=Geodia barretti TaxID=519541 RepID=A0AA35SE55_GEOBA|nr:RNA pyrophosphohydrolase [Geodia barretti]